MNKIHGNALKKICYAKNMFCETEHLIMAMMASKKHVGSLKNVLGSELRRLHKVTFQAYI